MEIRRKAAAVMARKMKNQLAKERGWYYREASVGPTTIWREASKAFTMTELLTRALHQITVGSSN